MERAIQREESRDIPDIAASFPEEAAHLEQIMEKVSLELAEAERSVEKMDQEYRDTQIYMMEHRNEGDAKEIFQSEMALRQIDSLGVSAVVYRDRMRKTKDSPYFARIDFRPEGGDSARVYYIGLYAFHFEQQLLVIDWRAPVASMFYDYELGRARYDAPEDHVEGDLVLKRQFKIKNGRLEYAFDSSQNIQDDILQMELAHTSDEKMKSIISTIQKEQNQIIRNETAHTMIIQGVAGSGKTSIALHRVAFLLYRHRDTIKAQNVTIISPNRVFGDYISNVLPELGEEPIFDASLEDLALVQLEEGVDFSSDRNPLENADKAWEERVRFKSTIEFVRLMDAYIEKLPETALKVQDYVYESFTVPAEWIQARVDIYKRFPLVKRLEIVADDLYNRLERDNVWEEKLPHRTRIFISLKKMLRLKNTLAAYKDFYQRVGQPKMYVPVKKGVLEWNDVYPYLYLQAAFTGLQESHLIKHLVIDEMQDYSPIQYAVLNRLFKCPKTILGDFGQSINPNCPYTLEELHRLYEGSELVRMEKSYRSTYEIIHFARRIIEQPNIEAVERHGEPPAVLEFQDREEELACLLELVEAFRRSPYNAMGIILRTDREAKELFERLKERQAEVALVTPESDSFHNGVLVLSVRMSKGLEFDEVLIPGADAETYREGFDRNLLYVACTRAMHKLTVTYAGRRSPLLPV